MAYSSITKPTDYFNTVLYTGNGSSQSITGVGHQPDWTWVKSRGSTAFHLSTDSVRGVTKQLYPNADTAENTDLSHITAFNTDGFSVGSAGDVNGNSLNLVSWNWKAGGSASSNSNGSITSSVSVSTDAGFSIVSYTGNATSGATLGHGLGIKPAMIISKNRDEAQNWFCYHKSLGATDYIRLNLTNASGSATSIWNDTEPTTSVFSVGNDTATNGSSDKIIAYCFADVKGYSKFGKYTGNGNADGTFVYTGFKPAWVMFKEAVGTSPDNWFIYDNKRSTFNPLEKTLRANTNGAETDLSATAIDMLSNGFKLRTADTGLNESGGTYIFMAFAEAPFVTAGTKAAGTAR